MNDRIEEAGTQSPNAQDERPPPKPLARVAVRSIALFGIILSGCVSAPRVYQPPDASVVTASSRRLSASVDKAQATSRHETTLIASAKSAGSELLRVAPLELRPQVAALNAKVSELEAAHLTLEVQLSEAELAKAQFHIDADKYLEDAQKVANEASAERAARIKAEKALAWYRWHWWGAWIALGAGLIACGFVAFLKFTGRMSLSAASIAAKL